MTLLDGLGSPMKALGPELSIRWQERGIPVTFMSLTASYSVIPGSRLNTTSRTAWEVWLAAYSNHASWSTSFTALRPSVGCIRRLLAFTTLRLPTASLRASAMYEGTSSQYSGFEVSFSV